jgi:Fe2+ or Zn2+ uptake regulation protein
MVSKPFLAAGTAPTPLGTVDEVMGRLRAGGGRATSARRALLHVLFEARCHMSADQIAHAVHERLPDVHMSTVYRNLEELQRLGVVAHTHLGHGAATYELASVAHAHVICEDCGALAELPDEFFRGLAEAAEARLGFSIDPHHFAILGRCTACKQTGPVGRPCS